MGIQKLLKEEPNIESPAQQEPLNLYKNNREEYLRKVKMFAFQCRKKTEWFIWTNQYSYRYVITLTRFYSFSWLLSFEVQPNPTDRRAIQGKCIIWLRFCLLCLSDELLALLLFISRNAIWAISVESQVLSLNFQHFLRELFSIGHWKPRTKASLTQNLLIPKI